MPVPDSHDSKLLREALASQFAIAWSLTAYHLDGLTTEACLWRPASRCLHVYVDQESEWHAEWPDRESYDIGPPSIAWTLWHIGFWWKNALRSLEGEQPLEPGAVAWAGSAQTAKAEIEALRDRWTVLLEQEDNFLLPRSSSWPLAAASLAQIAAWLNLELMKNAAEIGLVRFLHGVRPTDSGS